jgi:hypothetical protein
MQPGSLTTRPQRLSLYVDGVRNFIGWEIFKKRCDKKVERLTLFKIVYSIICPHHCYLLNNIPLLQHTWFTEFSTPHIRTASWLLLSSWWFSYSLPNAGKCWKLKALDCRFLTCVLFNFQTFWNYLCAHFFYILIWCTVLSLILDSSAVIWIVPYYRFLVLEGVGHPDPGQSPIFSHLFTNALCHQDTCTW